MTRNIGLIGDEWTNTDDGHRSSDVTQMNAAGQAAGNSTRYDSGTESGQSSWLYYPATATTRDISLVGNEWTRDDGYRYSGVSRLGAAGLVVGYAYRYNGGSTQLGQSAWLYDPATATTRNISLVGNEWTRNDGYRYSLGGLPNAAGQITGLSERFEGSRNLGQSAWLYEATTATTRDISLVGNEWTRYDGYRFSGLRVMNEAGMVVGNAIRYNGGNSDRGRSIWFYDPTTGTTRDISLLDPGNEWTRDDGYRYSTVDKMDAAGRARGTAWRYNGGRSQRGQSVWLYDPATATTSNISLVGPGNEWTRNDGWRESSGFGANAAGLTLGTAFRYNGGSAELGYSSWIYDPATGATRDISLVGDEWTRNDGYRAIENSAMNEAGQVAGLARRYNGGSVYLGFSSWLYDPAAATAKDISLIGSGNEWTRNDGYRYCMVKRMNAAGQVAGEVSRYNGGSTTMGSVAWLFDPTTSQTCPMLFSTSSSGQASSSIVELTDGGAVVGSYRLYSGTSDLGDRAYYWSRADGFFDLGGQVVGGLAAQGFTSLNSVSDLSPNGLITGTGTLTTTANMPYQLSFAIVRWGGAAGTWQTSGDWQGSVTPRRPNQVVFNQAATFHVSFASDAQAQALNVVAGDVDFRLGGYTLTTVDAVRLGDPVTMPFATLDVNGGTLAAGAGLFIYDQATLAGAGTILADVKNAGSIRPGNSPGTLNIDGSLVSTGILAFEINGTSAGQFDRLLVSGAADLGGLIELKLGYIPTLGDRFDLLDWGSLTNSGYSFDLSQAGLSAGLAWDTSRFATDGTMAVVPEPATLSLLAVGLSAMFVRRRRAGK